MNEYLQGSKGVIHVGANVGQEIMEYAKYGLPVVWVEPIKEVYAQLVANLTGIPNQIAINCLVTDKDKEVYDFHIANNNGISSSIFELKGHKEVTAWANIHYERTEQMISSTLPSLLQLYKVDPKDYDVLVVDTQGADLLVLNGALSILSNFKYIQVEVADFEAYEGCCVLSDMQAFMTQNGYAEMSRFRFAGHPSGGSYFDIIYRKIEQNPQKFGKFCEKQV